MDEEFTIYSDYVFIPEAKFGFVDEEKFERQEAEKEALAEFIKINPALSEADKKLAEFLIALKGSI